MDFKNFTELRIDDIILKTITIGDKDFIESMFNDPQIRKFYIVPKEAYQDFRRLIGYWINDMQSESGYAWLILHKNNSIFGSTSKCGFIAFEFRDSIKNARISYAILPNFRKKGIATKAVQKVLAALEDAGVETFEADIDRDNSASEKVIQKVGFSTNKSEALIDPEMMRDGEMRVRFMWKKNLTIKEFNDPIYLPHRITEQSALIEEINRIVSLVERKGQHPELISKYFYLLGRIKVNEGNYQEAYQAFGQCNHINTENRLIDNHETYYWFAKIRDMNNDRAEDVLQYLNYAIAYYQDNPELISRADIEKLKSKYQ